MQAVPDMQVCGCVGESGSKASVLSRMQISCQEIYEVVSCDDLSNTNLSFSSKVERAEPDGRWLTRLVLLGHTVWQVTLRAWRAVTSRPRAMSWPPAVAVRPAQLACTNCTASVGCLGAQQLLLSLLELRTARHASLQCSCKYRNAVRC